MDVAGDAARMESVSGDAQRGAVGTALGDPLVVRITDQFGNPVAGVSVTFAVGSGGGGGSSWIGADSGTGADSGMGAGATSGAISGAGARNAGRTAPPQAPQTGSLIIPSPPECHHAGAASPAPSIWPIARNTPAASPPRPLRTPRVRLLAHSARP